jgi:hypothetical protein
MTNWKLLPTDLTLEMKVAGLNKIDLALRVGMPEYDLTDGIEMAWDAMLEVAPTPPEPTPVYQRWMGEDMWQDCTKKQAEKPIIGDGSRTLFTYPISNAGLVRAADELNRLISNVAELKFTGPEQEERFHELRAILRSELDIYYVQQAKVK